MKHHRAARPRELRHLQRFLAKEGATVVCSTEYAPASRFGVCAECGASIQFDPAVEAARLVCVGCDPNHLYEPKKLHYQKPNWRHRE